MKWSDGHPFTTEDIQFWYEDIFADPEVQVLTGQGYWFAQGEVGVLEVVDEQTFSVRFAHPNGFFAAAARLGAAGPDDTVTQALPPAVPHQVQSGRQRARQGARAGKLDRAVPARERARRSQRLLPELEAPDPRRLEVQRRSGREHRAGVGRAQSLLLQGRYRGHAAALFRPHRLSDGRRSPGPAAEDFAGRDRHDGPVHRHAEQQIGILRRAEERATSTSIR